MRFLKRKNLVKAIYVDEKIIDYIVSLVFTTRMPQNTNLKTLHPTSIMAYLHAQLLHYCMHQKHVHSLKNVILLRLMM